ncbi:ABC transporter permease, partial [Mycoplasmopsis pullorum]|uniref:ABC transporter permease n=1 Tax=Mycoplasmopsis pullorum TaxID=48003 RepID=UPI0011185A65
NYDKLTTINPENGEKEEYTQKKILKLADFTKGQAGLEVNKFNNLGITTYKDKYIFVTPQIGPNNGWELAVFSNTNKTSFTLEEVFEIFKAKNITVRYSYLNPNGWADVDPTFKNLNSIILGLRTPSLDIINEAIKFGTINGMFDVVQKFLLNSDLVKSGLLSKENVYNIVEAGKYGSNKNKLTTLFANGKIKANIFPLIGFDALYYLTHTSSGDYFSTLVSDVLNNLKNILLTKGTVEEQKIYLEEQFSNLLTFIKDLSGSDLSLVLPKELFANFFKDPIALLDQLSELVASVDWKSFTEKINDFISNEYNKSITKDDKNWIIKLSSTQLFTWFLESIYPNNFKSVLIKIIENIDLSFDLENTNKATIINKILWMLPQNMRKVFINLFEEINKPNPADQPFLNVVNGVKNIIKLIDLKIFTESLKNSLKLQTFTNTILEYNESQDKAFYNQVQRAAYTFNSVDILQAFLKSLFSTPGANKIFKQNLIDMFNLSDKGSVINIDDQNKIIFPGPDEDKLDIFDLISNLSLITEKTTETDANAVIVNNEFEDNYLTLLNIQTKLKKATDAYKLSQLSEKERNFLNSWFDIDPNKIYLENKEITKVQSKIQAISEFFAFFQNNSKTFKIQDKLSLGDIGQIFNIFVNSEGNSYWNALHSLLQTIIPFQPKNNFSYGEEIYPFFKIWVRLFAWNAEIDWSIKQTFALNLLSFANKKSIIDYFNSPELLRHDSHNILKYEETDFAVSRSMIDPQKMSNLFFARDSKGDYLNADLRAFIALNPLFKDFIEKNQLDISATLSLVADSDHYYYYTEKELAILGSQYQYKGLYSILAFNLINTLGSWESFKNNPSLLLKVTESIDGISGLSFIGVPEMMTNPLFISFIPQTLIWFLADINSYTTQPKNIANLAYLIMNKTINFEELANQSKEEMYEWYSYFNKTGLNPIFPLLENEDTLNIILDDEYFARLVNSDNAKEHKYNFFGVDLGKLLYTAIDTISPISYDSKFLRYNSDSAYVAKVNYAYLLKNNKSIYSGELPKDPIKLNELIERMDEKYILNVNGIKYIIIGEDITVDYLYPVIDENNLQVNTKNQGIVYVNQEGFDRIRFAHQSNNVKNYLLVKNSTSKSSAELRDEFEEKVQDLLINSTKIRRVYLTDELDVLNPERSLRVSVISGIINSIYNSSRLILALLVAIVAVSIIFIIRRYISNKNKVLGILLAQGYSSFEIALSLTAFATFVTVGGGILGYLVGHFSQTAAMRVLDSYWTLPTVPNVFSITSFLVTIILPLIGMSVLIILIALKSLRYKAIDLMSGINEIRIGNLRNKWHLLFKKSRVTTRFSALLLFGSFWKLISFGFSIILTSITIIFGISTFKVFDKSVDYTYQNRNYNFRYDLFTPTRQGGPLNTYNYDNLENSLYVPVGDSIEIRTAAYDYFKPGHSSILNAFPDKNGNPDDFTAHIITQFAVNVTVDSSISIDPWAITYNQMPDSQKSRINELRNKLGIALEGTQDGVYIKEDGTLDFENTIKTKGFFHFLINRNNPSLSKFVYYEYDSFTKEYAISQITTTFKRDEFREFLISAYNKLRATSDLKDFLIGFGGIYFDSSEDEKFSYATVEFKNSKDQFETINMYGYASNSEKVKLIARNSENLLEKLNTDLIDGKYVPLVVNVVAAKKYNLTKGDILTGNVLNTVDRYTNKMNELLNIPNANNSATEFKVVGINPTYINTEFLIAKRWADKLTGLDTLNFKDGIPFNGILSSSKFPQQLLSSVSLYSPSGYWPALSNLDTSTMNLNEQQQIFDNLFGPQGLLKLQGWSDGKIVKFLNPNSSLTYEKQLEISRAEPYISIDKFSKVYDNQVLSLIANTIDSKDIQVGFAKTISSTVQTIVTSIIILSFIITIVILIILSTIIIGENEKNIAIWTILGYSQKEKLVMFFSIFIPFILISILFAIPIAYGIISFFSWILIVISGLAIPISITVWNVFVTLSVVMAIFLATSLLVWRYINKIKAIDLLKGK